MKRFTRAELTASVLGLVTTLAVGAARAVPPQQPLPGITFQANQAYVGDSLLGMQSGDAGDLYAFNADQAQHMASTTKSFTLLSNPKILTLNRQMKESFPHVELGTKPVCYEAFNTPPRDGVSHTA